MENTEKDNPPWSLKAYEHRIHRILAHSYSSYFLLLLIGVALDIFFPLKIFKSSITAPVGLAFLALATVLIFWAQHTSRNLDSTTVSKENFCRGPYCYTRNPTHWGLFMLTLGFGIVANAFFVIVSTIISFIVTKFIFIKKQEGALEEKYGQPYMEYKKSVKL